MFHQNPRWEHGVWFAFAHDVSTPLTFFLDVYLLALQPMNNWRNHYLEVLFESEGMDGHQWKSMNVVRKDVKACVREEQCRKRRRR